MATNNIYDMMRAKAKEMGHPIAKLPNNVWQKYMDIQDDRSTLREAKLYIENYMMGNLNPAEFAQIMAEDDNLRYTISDLCRMRLEPVDFDVQRNNSYIDVGAGVKTFWKEIRVPLPSEVDAAWDIRNINYGIEAGRATAGVNQSKDMPNAESDETAGPGRKRTFRDVLNDVKKKAAEKAIEKLTPIVEGEEKAEDPAKPVQLDESWLETEEGQEYRDAYTRHTAQQLENTAMNIEAGKSATLDPDERKKALEAAGMEPENAEEFLAENPAADEEAVPGDVVEENPFQSRYSTSELNSTLDYDMKELFDQIMTHVDHDRNNNYQTGNKHNDKYDDKVNYVKGTFNGESVSVKNSWGSHEFTEEEMEKLFAGETISINYIDKENVERTVPGRLEWQNYNGRRFLGFKADHAKQISEYDMSLMNYSMGDDVQRSQEQLAQDMETYRSDETIEYPDDEFDDGFDDDVTLSAEDCAALFEDAPYVGL